MSHYRQIVIETYGGPRDSSTGAPPARPVAGQKLDTNMKVECSSSMRKSQPIGTMFLIKAKLTEVYGVPFLYSSYRWSWKMVSAEEAAEHIKNKRCF